VNALRVRRNVGVAPFRFAGHELDPAGYQLRRNGEVLKLEKIPMELLLLLVERHGRLITREEIIAKLWGQDVFLDTEQGINTAIRKIRLVLKDEPDNPRFVQTIVGKGYRFIAPLEGNGVGDVPLRKERQLALWTRGAIAAIVAVLCIMGTYVVVGRLRPGDQGKPLRAEAHLVEPEVYETYLKGEAMLRKDDLESSARAFEAVIARDPRYAPAYAALALVHSDRAGWLPPQGVMPKAEELARQALALDPNLAEAHAVLGQVHLRYHWDWAEAEAEISRALALSPSSVTSHRIYGDYLMAMGRFEEALVERRKTAMLDPTRSDLYMEIGNSLIKLERYDEAAAEFRRAHQLDPESCDPHVGFSTIYEKQGKPAAAMAEMRQQMEHYGPGLQKYRAVVERAYARKGYREARRALSRELVKERIKMVNSRYVPPMAIAILSAKAGYMEISLAYFEKALQQRSPELAMLNAVELPPELRSHPRFLSVLRRVGVPQPPTVLAAK
jgi:DNA-binding winged helix-turn-helix (wHTH) protein/Tfp pilus assembly protein PilF